MLKCVKVRLLVSTTTDWEVLSPDRGNVAIYNGFKHIFKTGSGAKRQVWEFSRSQMALRLFSFVSDNFNWIQHRIAFDFH